MSIESLVCELQDGAGKANESLAADNTRLRTEIASLRALVKEIADDLRGYLCESECNGACASFGHCCSQTSRQIVAKAREVLK